MGVEEHSEFGLVAKDDVHRLGLAGADFLEGLVVDFAVAVDGADDVVRGGLEPVGIFYDEFERMNEAAVATGEGPRARAWR